MRTVAQRRIERCRNCRLRPVRTSGTLAGSSQGYPKGRPLSCAGLSILRRLSMW